MTINIQINDTENKNNKDLKVKINGKSIENELCSETVEEEFKRKVKRSKASHINRWVINEENCHLIGMNAREFNRFIDIPIVAVFLNDSGGILREEFFRLIKRMPQLYAEASDEYNSMRESNV